MNFQKKLGTVIYRPETTSIADIEDAIRRAGYHPKVLEQTPVNDSVNEKVK